MSLIDLADGGEAWVCDPLKWAIYPEQYQRVAAELPERNVLRRILGEHSRKYNIPSFAVCAAGAGLRTRKEQAMQIGERLRTIIVEPLELPMTQPTDEPEPVPVPEAELEQTPTAQ